MKVLFVWPVAHMSIWDVARGYRAALARQIGEANIRDYYLDKHTAYHTRAVPDEIKGNIQVVSRYASETILNEAMYFGADVVWIISGLNVHPICLWLMDKVGIPAAALFTESPYEDIDQDDWASPYRDMLLMTNDRHSAETRGWHYVPHSLDPAIHRPVPPAEVAANCDVLFIGTGWPERQKLLESIDWTGIDLRVLGIWPDLTDASPIYKYHTSNVVDNASIAKLYCGAKICLNHHRGSNVAVSLGPRAYEIAGCGAFQLCDYRTEAIREFGDSIPIYRNAEELEGMIHYYLDHGLERARLARKAHQHATRYTFDDRLSGPDGVLARLTSYVSEYRTVNVA